MFILGVAVCVIGLCSAIYSSLSSDIRLIKSRLFKNLPIARFFINASFAISRLEEMEPAERGYYADALCEPVEENGFVDETIIGFKELIESMRQKQLMSNQPINIMHLKKVTSLVDGNMELTLVMMKNDVVIQTLPLKSTQILKDAVDELVKHKIALFTMRLAIGAFVIGIILILIDKWG